MEITESQNVVRSHLKSEGGLKIKWCKLMLTKKVILGKRFREGELGRDGWRKVYDLFEKVKNPFCIFFLTYCIDQGI